MKCDAAERAISSRLDTGGGSGEPELEQHLAGCPGCRDFKAGSLRLREAARVRAAGPVPGELVGTIMARVASTESPSHWSGSRWLRPAFRPVIAAFLLGALTSGVVIGGLVPRSPRMALAAEIPRRIAEASSSVDHYRAVFDITEHNFHPQVPVRRFRTEIHLYSREQFTAATQDLNRYPPGNWPRNDIVLEVDRGRWRLEEPSTCPRLALPACEKNSTQVRAVTGREPFDGDTPLPTDIILPLRTLAGTERVQVVGAGLEAGRNVVKVRIAYRDALPLFGFLQVGGSWRPFHPTDEVTLALDRDNWAPVAYEVRVSRSPDRVRWAEAQGLAADRSGQVIFQATSREISYDADGSIPGMAVQPEDAHDGGFVDLEVGTIAERTGLTPLEPAALQGLNRYRAGVYRDAERSGEVLLSYAEGLKWLKIRQTQSWDQEALFGNIGPLAAAVDLPGGGVAYYEPATAELGRRLSIHSENGDFYLESNLGPDDLLAVAGSLPVNAITAPTEWSVRRWPGGIVREQVSYSQAIARAPYLLMPAVLPEGYEVAAAHLITTPNGEGVTVFLRRPGMEADGVGIRVHQAPAETMPPPMDPDVLLVRVGELNVRYSPARSEAEWIQAGGYRSITAAALSLEELSILVESMSTAEGDAVR